MGDAEQKYMRLLAESSVPVREQRVLIVGAEAGPLVDFFREAAAFVAVLRGGEGGLPKLPFPAGDFTTLVARQVLQRLDPSGGLALIGEFLEEAHRVLSPEGLLVVDTTSREQLVDGWWYFDFIRDAVRRLAERYPPVGALESMLKEARFSRVSEDILYEELLRGEDYLDPDGPLDPEWRAKELVWSLASKDELAAALEKLSELKRAGTLRKLVADHERTRLRSGQSLLVSAFKNPWSADRGGTRRCPWGRGPGSP